MGAIKGAILSVNEKALIVDITHEIPPHDIYAAAFTLLAVYKTFPARTIHLVVVDPGVGSARRSIIVVSGNQLLVGPDNGIFSYIYERETDCRVIQIKNEKYFRHPISSTFHGRDIFAPVAGALSKGISPSELGDEITDFVRLPALAPKSWGDGSLEASVIHIDRFGNCITNLSRQDLTEEMYASAPRLVINGNEINAFRKFYGEEQGAAAGDMFVIWGSAGFLEIGSFLKSAAQLLNAQVGQSITLYYQKSETESSPVISTE